MPGKFGLTIASFLGLLVLAVSAYAAETSAETTGESQGTIRDSFHLITFKCEPDTDEAAQTTPQSPPLDVDDPETPGCNHWEINIVVDGDLTSNQTSWELPLLDMNYGVGDNIQLKYEVPFLNQQADGISSSAMGESIAGVKYMFFDDDASKTQFAIYPQLTFVGSSADVVRKGLVTPGSIVTVPFLMSKQIGQTGLGPVSLSANLGYNFSNKVDMANYVSAAFGIGAPVSKRIGIMGELTTDQAIAADSTGTREQLIKTDIGMMGTVTKNFILFGALGHSLTASDQFDHSYLVAGFQVLAGGF